MAGFGWLADLLRSVAAFRRGVRVRKGDHVRTLVDIQTTGLVYFFAPMTSGLRCRIPRGAVLRVYDTPNALTLLCTTTDAALEEELVPTGYRDPGKYAGLALAFGIGEIGRRLELLAPESGAPQ